MVGHKKNSTMLINVYSHLGAEDVEEELKRQHGLNGAKPLTPQIERITCPRCKKIWPPMQKYCECGWLFDAQEIEKREQGEQQKVELMIEAALKEKGLIK
jgi:hypothetical protein